MSTTPPAEAEEDVTAIQLLTGPSNHPNTAADIKRILVRRHLHHLMKSKSSPIDLIVMVDHLTVTGTRIGIPERAGGIEGMVVEIL